MQKRQIERIKKEEDEVYDIYIMKKKIQSQNE